MLKLPSERECSLFSSVKDLLISNFQKKDDSNSFWNINSFCANRNSFDTKLSKSRMLSEGHPIDSKLLLCLWVLRIHLCWWYAIGQGRQFLRFWRMQFVWLRLWWWLSTKFQGQRRRRGKTLVSIAIQKTAMKKNNNSKDTQNFRLMKNIYFKQTNAKDFFSV